MKKKRLIIVNNNLDQFHPFLQFLEKSLPYETVLISIMDLLKEDGTVHNDQGRVHDTLLITENNVFRKFEHRIRRLFEAAFQSPFLNYLPLYTDPEEFKQRIRENPEESGYILFSGIPEAQSTALFHTFIREIFAKATASYRLSDYIYNSFKGVVYSEILKQKKMEIERLNHELEQRNRIDPLTNLFNRKALFEFLDKERNRTLRNLFKIGAKQLENTKEPYTREELPRAFSPEFIEGNIIIFSVMMIDLDKFKEVNDTYGHLAGDVVLKTMGDLFRNTGILREQDIVGRFGGEEFIVILPGTTSSKAKKPARRLADDLAGQTFEDVEGNHFKVTMSVGISEYHPHDTTGDAIIQRADKALYAAKESGRNRTVVYEEVFHE